MPFKKIELLNFVREYDRYIANLDLRNPKKNTDCFIENDIDIDDNSYTYLQKRHVFSSTDYEPGLNRLERIHDMPYMVLNKTQMEQSYFIAQTKIFYDLIDEHERCCSDVPVEVAKIKENI